MTPLTASKRLADFMRSGNVYSRVRTLRVVASGQEPVLAAVKLCLGTDMRRMHLKVFIVGAEMHWEQIGLRSKKNLEFLYRDGTFVCK